MKKNEQLTEIVIDNVRYKMTPITTPGETLTGYEPAEENGIYYYVTANGYELKDADLDREDDRECLCTANYYTDKDVAENCARADELMRMLRRWQALHDTPIVWDGYTMVHTIAWEDGCLKELGAYHRYPGCVYFSTAERARAAIEEFRDELTWYYTKYKARKDDFV